LKTRKRKPEGWVPLESDIQAGVLKWLKAAGVYAWRMPIGPVIHGNGRWCPSPLKGFPDIAILLRKRHRGVLAVVEMKRPKKSTKVEPDQADWLTELAAGGAKACVARSLEDVVRFLVECGEVDPQHLTSFEVRK